VNRIRPDLPVLLCSGFEEVIRMEEARKVGVQEVLMKPITASEIAYKVRQTLERIYGNGHSLA
jgi:PleD family two-component response regulator